MKPVFVDTMGWYSLLDRRDEWHRAARDEMDRLRAAATPLVTTDYILDETATLLKVRRALRAIQGFFDSVGSSRMLTVTPVNADRFDRARTFFLKQLDHGYSFTDVTSFVVMQELGLTDVLTHDAHFAEAGFVPLLRSD